MLRRLIAGMSLGVVAAAGSVAIAGPASASVVSIGYDVTGSSTIVKTNSTVALGPTTLVSNLNADGTFTGTMALPSTTTSFKIIGLLPVKAKVSFTEVGDLSGALTTSPTVAVSATAQYTIKLSNVTVAGIPAFVGSNCQTASPVTIPVATPAGQTFDVTNGGSLTGTYTIGKFQHCGLTTSIINLLIPGPGNTASLTLSNGHVVS